MIVPAWINPTFRLVEDGKTHDWASVAALAAKLEAELPMSGRVAVTGGSVVTLVAALVAAQRAGVELVLLRENVSRPAGSSLQINEDGRVVRLGPAVTTAEGFVLLIPTSGTTGEPKLVCQDFTRLIGRVRGGHSRDSRWLLAYEPTAFGGLQVILTAVTTGATLIAAPRAGAAQLARLALMHQATHLSATPGVWRSLLPFFAGEAPPLQVLTLGGDIIDQPLLDRLRTRFPKARPLQIYASSEAGVVFTVKDGQAGFPAAWLESGVDDVHLRVRNGQLEVQCPRIMLRYAGGESRPFTVDHWLITGDLVARTGERVLFIGRAEALLDLSGVKVPPAKVEQALYLVPGVAEVLVAGETGPGGRQVLVASVVPEPGTNPDTLRAALSAHIASLPVAEQPQRLDFVGTVTLAPSGKKMRVRFF
jgi:acyl-coenzyme A synthetase/AMP-(fatty) acid ligase